MRHESDLLTLAEAGEVLRLKVSTLRAWILRRKVAHVKLGSRVFLRRADVEALIARSIVPALEVTEQRRQGTA